VPGSLVGELTEADPLLAIFFFVAGIEVKEELVHGELTSLKSAALPVIAAFAGMAVPALCYLAVSWGAPGAARGWAIPMATDIAFALSVLAGIGFTVSLLIGDRAYPGSERVTTAVLVASLIAAALAAALLHVRVQARTRHDVP
jgi:Na+/H+ antiporter NhaA